MSTNPFAVIGSNALKLWYPDFPREPKDVDVAFNGSAKTFSYAKSLYQERYPDKQIELLENPVVLKYIPKYANARPYVLLTLKMSHLFWDIKWDKHMFDVQFLLNKGVRWDDGLLWELYDYWNTVHPHNRRSDLTMNKEDFFDNALTEFDHDHLHTLINPNPTYISMLAEGKDVELDEKKFNNASYREKEALVREEVYVMAFERFRKLGYRRANSRMLKKYIIGHVPLFAATFVIQNYVKLLTPEYDFVKIIEEKL